MIIYFIIVSSTCLSANDKRLQVNRRAVFCRKESRDENPGISFPSLQIPDFDGTVISSVEVF